MGAAYVVNRYFHLFSLLTVANFPDRYGAMKKQPKQSNPKLTVFARITPELRERLDSLAATERRTISQLILFALERQYLEKP